MIELYISQNNNTTSQAYGKYYPRVSYKQTMGIHEMAVHMAEHNTPFSEGTIEGILRDFVKCTLFSPMPPVMTTASTPFIAAV